MSQPPTRTLSRIAAALVASVLTCVVAPAWAQGNGLKVGEGRLHPFFDLETRFDSAAAVVPKAGELQRFEMAGDLMVRFKPGLKYELLGSDLQLNLAGNLDYVQYTGVINPGTRAASRLQGEADLDLGINRGGAVSLDLGDHFVRSDRTVTTVLGVGALSLFNDARAQLNIRPGGGALSFEPNYHLTTEFFSPFSAVRHGNCAVGDSTCDPGSVSKLNYMSHTFGVNARWKFLPKTALVIDSDLGYRMPIAGGTGENLLTLKAMGGIAGLLTPRIATTAKIGYGRDFSLDTYNSVIAMAEIAWLLSQTAQIRAGYTRTFEPMGGGQFHSYGDDRAYLDARMLLAGKMTLRAQGAYDYLTYRGPTAGTAHNVTGDLGADYEIQRWVNVGLGYLFTNRQSATGQAFLNLRNFQRHEVYGRVQFIY